MTATPHTSCDYCSGSVLDAADRALATGNGVILDQHQLGILLDLELIEDWANENCVCAVDDGWRLIRPDGRTVILFRRGGA